MGQAQMGQNKNYQPRLPLKSVRSSNEPDGQANHSHPKSIGAIAISFKEIPFLNNMCGFDEQPLTITNPPRAPYKEGLHVCFIKRQFPLFCIKPILRK